MCELCAACGMDADACGDNGSGWSLACTGAPLLGAPIMRDRGPEEATGGGVSGFQAGFEGTHHSNMQALIAGVMWYPSNVTFSFPDATSDYTGSPSSYGTGELTNGFAPFNAQQQLAAQRAMALVEQYTDLSLAEITGAQGSADIRMALSDEPGTAWAYYPSGASTGGDIWVNGSSGWYDNPLVGTYANHTIMHEVGHALGLKHGHESGGYGSLSPAFDQMAYSVMTYKSHTGSSGGGYTNEFYGYAQTFMLYDIAALQALYGVDWAHNAGDSTYTWSASTGEMSINGAGQGAPGSNRIFSTLWDAGGTDTIDLSAYANDISADLKPGGILDFSQIQTAQLAGGVWADGNVWLALAPDNDPRAMIENIIAGVGADTLLGNAADNVIDGMGGADLLKGREGDDHIIGRGGKDLIRGGAGDDRLEGGIGPDKMRGQAGADVFVLNDGSGKDIATDFELYIDKVDVPVPGSATLTVSNTGHLTVEYMGDWMVLRGLNPGDATLGDLVI